MSEETTNIICDLCGTKDFRALFKFKNGADSIVKCRECGLVFSCRDKEEQTLATAYDSLDYEQPSGSWLKSRLDSFLPYMDKLGDKKRLLEVGSGHGFFLDACRKDGWECTGIDISQKAVTYARDHYGLKMICGTLENAGIPDESFEAVLLWNVLDEVASPSSLMTEVHRVLCPGGRVLVRIRNADFHLPAKKMLAMLSLKYDPSVIHLFAFNKRTVRRIFEKSEFKRIAIDNALLTWTQRAQASSWKDCLRGILAKLMGFGAGFIKIITSGKILISPSISVYAEKGQE